MPIFSSMFGLPGGTPGTVPQPMSSGGGGGMLANRFDNPLSALAITLGPALMAKGFGIPGLAGAGPQLLGLAQRQRESAQSRAMQERQIKLAEDKAARDAAMRESVSRMFAGAPAGPMSPATALAASTAAGRPGPTREAAAMIGAPGATPAASGGMFGGLTDEDRRMAAVMAASDPMAALSFAGGRSFDREKAAREAARKGPGGPFGGTGIQAQVLNTLSSADPSSFEYRAAFEEYAKPRTNYDPVSGTTTTITPDTSWLAPPTWSATGTLPAAPAPAAAETRTAEAPGTTTRRAGSSIITTTEGRPTRPSQPQLQAGGFASRIQGANDLLSDLDKEGTSLSGYIKGQIPLGNYLQTPEYQQYQQARDDFINAQLRRESGAAISAAEYDNADRQYFPQPGDSPQVIKQKRQNRQNVLESLEREAGPGYERPVRADTAPGLPGTAEELREMSDEDVLKALGIGS